MRHRVCRIAIPALWCLFLLVSYSNVDRGGTIGPKRFQNQPRTFSAAVLFLAFVYERSPEIHHHNYDLGFFQDLRKPHQIDLPKQLVGRILYWEFLPNFSSDIPTYPVGSVT